MAATARPEQQLYVYDPIFPRKKAAEYLGRSPRTLDRLELARDPLPGTAAVPEMGYRLSTLNRYLESLKDPKSRTRKLRKGAS